MYQFIPAIRHGVNEQKALNKLSQELSQKSGQQASNKVKPLLEIVHNDDLNNIAHYTSEFDEVFVDFPRYLVDRENKHKDDVSDIISDYNNDPVKFFSKNSKLDYTPVISGSLDPISYSGFVQYIQSLQSDFNRICVRLFIPINTFTSSEENELKSIISELRDQDAVLADVVDVDQLSTAVRPNIDFIKSEIGNQDFYVFDVFEPRGEVNYNYGLVMGKHANVDGVGDFSIEPRFPNDIPDAAFQNIPKRVRQYDSSSHSVSTTEDSDHYVKAVDMMLKNNNLDINHCPACEKLYNEYQTVKSNSSRKDLDAGFVKQMRMNHYTYSVLAEEFPDMTTAADAASFDRNGYTDIS
ncbi:hypothetical protein NDI56_08070 [Haloarcula sp. S1CR25-12]|uniref:Uncharacterized protein n=1 Tax=Haloarcula saliterrae TaxID=2950534 RepID=A0ABU2FBX4_9EURY|nr:hypothetical protein [Haloarcula sp. S1CR25-12]MDS0259345.1 hypothetical protein [Haloarcula sp. S1CR25-12]